MVRLLLGAISALVITNTQLLAQDVRLTENTASVSVEVAGKLLTIERIQDPTHKLTNDFTKTSRPCPPFCIQPMTPAPGVTTIGELELLDMLADPEAIVIDSRTPDWFEGGSIPGAVNVPYLEAVERLPELGCEIGFDQWDCEQAAEIVLFCNGLWCGQSPTAIRWMIDAGYPPEKISYYRGGMQSWRVLGLTVTGPGD